MSFRSPPFGPLNPFHEHIIAQARPLTWTNWPVAVLPSIPLGVIALLLQYPNTRPWRIVVGGIGVGLMGWSVVSYRFVGTLPSFYHFLPTVSPFLRWSGPSSRRGRVDAVREQSTGSRFRTPVELL